MTRKNRGVLAEASGMESAADGKAHKVFDTADEALAFRRGFFDGFFDLHEGMVPSGAIFEHGGYWHVYIYSHLDPMLAAKLPVVKRVKEAICRTAKRCWCWLLTEVARGDTPPAGRPPVKNWRSKPETPRVKAAIDRAVKRYRGILEEDDTASEPAENEHRLVLQRDQSFRAEYVFGHIWLDRQNEAARTIRDAITEARATGKPSVVTIIVEDED